MYKVLYDLCLYYSTTPCTGQPFCTKFCIFSKTNKKGLLFMSDLYNRIHGLCEELQISDAEVCKAVQMPRSTLSNLKNGHAKKLGAEKLNSFSLFFSKSLGRRITVEYLLGEAEENQTVDDLAASVPLAMYNGNQYDQVPEDIKQLAAAFALAKKEQEIKDPALRKIIEVCKSNPEYIKPLSIMLDQLVSAVERKGGVEK